MSFPKETFIVPEPYLGRNKSQFWPFFQKWEKNRMANNGKSLLGHNLETFCAVQRRNSLSNILLNLSKKSILSLHINKTQTLSSGLNTSNDTNISNDALLEMQMAYLGTIEPTTTFKYFCISHLFLK